MSYCSDLGYVVGDLFRVIDTENSFYRSGMIVKLKEDDGSASPWFTYVSGPTSSDTFTFEKFCIMLPFLKKIESTNESINVTYSKEDIIDAFYYLDGFVSSTGHLLHALEKVSKPEYKEYLRLKAKYETNIDLESLL